MTLGDEDDLRIDPLQRRLELLLVAHFDDAIDAFARQGDVEALDLLAVDELAEREEACVRACGRPADENGKSGLPAGALDLVRRPDGDCLRPGRLRQRGEPRYVALQERHDRDTVPLRDRLAEATHGQEAAANRRPARSAVAAADPTRPAPALSIASTSASVSIPPQALTPTLSGRQSRSSSTSCTAAASGPTPVDVCAKSNSASSTILAASFFSLSLSCEVPRTALRRTAPRPPLALLIRTVRATETSSSRTRRASAVRRACVLTTNSSSPAPSATARRASAIFVRARARPAGRPTTAHTFTSPPRNSSAAGATCVGSTQTEATCSSRARRQISSTSATVASGSSSVWSMVFESSSNRKAMGARPSMTHSNADGMPNGLQLEVRRRMPRGLPLTVSDDALHILG